MLFKRVVIPFISLICALSVAAAQDEEQWSGYLGKNFDSVVVALKHQSAICDTHHLNTVPPTIVAMCLPYEFIGEKGILVLRRSKSGIIKSCSWIKGSHPSFQQVMNEVDSTRREQVNMTPGALDNVFSQIYNYYETKWKINLATDDGAYLWTPAQHKRKNVEYTMSRRLEYIEFTATLHDQYKQQKQRPDPGYTGK